MRLRARDRQIMTIMKNGEALQGFALEGEK
jgi:hypothetical protein